METMNSSTETRQIAHPFQLPPRVMKAEVELAKALKIGEEVLYNDLFASIVSIFPFNSPLAGFVLVAGIGRPIRASEIGQNKELIQTNDIP